jgi:6-phospho-beta-glucosidase
LYPGAQLARQRAQQQSRGAQLLAVEAALLSAYANADSPTGLAALRARLATRGAKWYDAIIAPVLRALITGEAKPFVLNITNGDVLPWLPRDAIIETPCVLRDGGAQALPALPQAALERDLIARIQLNCAYEQLVVDAVLERSHAKALRALALNPLVPDMAAAHAVLAYVAAF